MKNGNLPCLQITELILVKCGEDWTRTFIGEIRREKNEKGKSIVFGNVVINGGRILSEAETEEELLKNLDELCLMKLDGNLNDTIAITSSVAMSEFNLN